MPFCKKNAHFSYSLSISTLPTLSINQEKLMALFCKALNRVDIEQGVVFDHEYTAAFPPLENGLPGNLSVSDGRTTWDFVYSLTASGRVRFTGQWTEFAKYLEPGNKVYFYDNKDEATGAQYKVVVRK